LFVFFFSSRRRHTRFSRDWSSDVCSSDLIAEDVDDSGLGELGLPGASAAAKIVIEGGALLKGGDISLRASAQAQDQWDVTAARQLVSNIADAFDLEQHFGGAINQLAGINVGAVVAQSSASISVG